jgi:thiamine-phosphate diphosphorylase
MSFDPRLVLVTDCASTAREAVAGGATAVQVRAKDADTTDLLHLVEDVVAVCPGVDVLVNDRVDVFLAARVLDIPVAGVHVGQRDLPAAVTRALVGPDAVVGLTANTPAHLATAAALPAGTVDYLGVGVLRATDTKPDHPPVLGVEGVAHVCAATDLPCVVIGGIAAADLPALRAAGAAGVAVASAIGASPDPRVAAARLRSAW